MCLARLVALLTILLGVPLLCLTISGTDTMSPPPVPALEGAEVSSIVALSQSYTSADSIAVDYPAGWVAAEEGVFTGVGTSPRALLQVVNERPIPADDYALVYGVVPGDDLTLVITFFNPEAISEDITYFGEFVEFTLPNGNPAARASFESSYGEGEFFLVQVDDETVVGIIGIALTYDTYLQYGPTQDALLNSLRVE